MKILHTENSCGWGGQEIRILTEATGLMKKGHEVALACPPEAPIYEAARERGLVTLPAPINRKNWRGLVAMYRLIRAWEPDIINTHSSTDSWLTAVAQLLGASPAPIVRTRHISAPVSPSVSNRWLYGKAARYVVTTGTRIRDELIEKRLVHPDRVASVHTGIDPERFRPGDRHQARAALGLDNQAFYLGIVATIRTWKGHAYLVEALARLPDAIHLLVIGDGPNRTAIESRVQELGLADRVRFVGHQQEVAPWLQALDLFVLPSYANEGVPQSLMQAMLCRIPVVSTPVGSIEDIIHHQKTGWLVPPRDSNALTQALSHLYERADVREAMASAGHEFASRHCTLDSMVEQMDAIFRKVVDER
ncbi:glycosyltransferase family 4 protein [Hahella sp. SMD15-11]|uniref:Glycosyltransferase family 4 protein n=1 Tax=Thermohahella caldifontis TaxID=3142973 RepID=A0AB39UV18_9GAMM